MEEYKPNSYKVREEQKSSEQEKKKVEKVTTGKVRTKKRSEVSKFKDIFISEDAASVKSYLFMDVLIPALKNTIEDLVTNGIRMLLRGDTSNRRSGSSISSVSYRDYSKMSRRDDDRYSSSRETRSGYSYDDIIVETRKEAEEILIQLDNLIDAYGQASVADLYDLVGITGKYTDNNYGWKNVRNAEPVPVRDGYLLRLPKVTPLNIR